MTRFKEFIRRIPGYCTRYSGYLRYKNYIVVLIASACIWRWYWASDAVGMHDAWDAMHYLKTGYDSFRGGLIPLWHSFGEHKRYFFAGGEYPVLPVFSFFLAQVLSLTVWIKTHYYLYLLFGAIGMTALLEKMGGKGFLPALFALVCFFSGRIQAFIYYQYTWVPMWAFMPWMLYFLIRSDEDWRYWIGIAVTTALFIFSAPAHAFVWAAGSLIAFALCRVLYDIRVVFRAAAGLVTGMLLAAPVLLPTLTYNWEGTAGRLTRVGRGYFDLHQVVTAFIGRFSQHRSVYFFPNEMLMWHEFYSYIGIIPVVLILAGLVAALYRLRTRRDARSRTALYCFLIAAAVLFLSWGTVMQVLARIHIPFAGTNPHPQRLTLVVIFWASVGAVTALSALWDTLRPKIRRILAVVSLAAVIFTAVDYTMLFPQIDAELPVSQGVQKMTVADLENPGWLARNQLQVLWDNPSAGFALQLLVPGNGLYFNFACDQETAVWFPNLDPRFVERYLRVRDVYGREAPKRGEKFLLPRGETCYRLYLSDPNILIGIFISLLTILFLVFKRGTLEPFLKPKGS